MVVNGLWQIYYTSQSYLLGLAISRLIAVVYFRSRVRECDMWLSAFIYAELVCATIVLMTSLLVGWAEVVGSNGQYRAFADRQGGGVGRVEFRLEEILKGK